MREQRRVEVAETRHINFCSRRVDGDRTSISVWCSTVGSAPSYGNQVRARNRRLTAPDIVKRQNDQTAHRRSLSLDKRGPHKCSAKNLLRNSALYFHGLGQKQTQKRGSQPCGLAFFAPR